MKRDMEYAMMDELVNVCRQRGIQYIYGYYYPTAKNGMVRNFYHLQGFEEVENRNGNTIWRFSISEDYEKKNKYIRVNQ